MKTDALDFIAGCAECQRHKNNPNAWKAALYPISLKPDATPFEVVAMDFITKLPMSQGYDSILTVTDHDCSKAVILIPCQETITAEGVAGLYVKHVFTRYGLPSKIISDHDPCFASKFTHALCEGLQIRQNISTAYHPHTDGQSERTNQWLEQYLRFWVDECQRDWALYLPIAEFVHNSWPHKTTRESPFFLLMGYNPRADWTPGVESHFPLARKRLDQFRIARHRAQELLSEAQSRLVKCCDMPSYQEGDQVWLEG